MYFLFYAEAFDNIMKTWTSKILQFDFLKNEKSFWSEIKKFFLVLQVLFFKLKKQTSKM